MFKSNNFDKLLDKATSNLRLDPDWPTILQICDLIRQNDCSPKYAVAGVKKKLYSQNPHQAMFALLTLESLVKNCGSGIHDEVTSKAFCEMLRDLVKTTQHENLRNKILELIQAWAFAFRNSPKYRAVQDTVNILKAEGYKFPALKESDAMFSADTAPEWADGEVCHRCRVAFSLIVRRHHCRACGQVFCQQCSSKTSTLPKFGIEKEVRVCDACYDKVSRPPTSSAKLEIVDTANDYGTPQAQKRPSGKTAEELQEEEELQLALALSQSEAEQKEKERKSRAHIGPDPTTHRPTVSPTPSSVSASPEHSTQANSELSRYLDRNYWEQRLSRDTTAAPTAPAPASHSSHTSHDTADDFTKITTGKAQDDDAVDKEIDDFVESLKSQVEIFVNRMKSNSSRGRSIANDTAVQTLFMNITAMHSRLLKYIQQQDDKRVYLESLQDKVTQIRDSRAALDTLRAEHAARLAAAAEAAERQRQMQMAAKLQAMRKKKHEYLQYQRQLALQRVQEQEREMQMRQEQQKHQYMMSANSGYFMPSVSMPQFQTGYQNQPIYGNPPFHQMMPQVTTDGSLPMPGQAQVSQANLPMGVNQMATVAQSMPQMSNTFPMSTSVAAIGQPTVGGQSAINQPNIRPPIGQQLPMHQQMMMQQMHQMRMPTQPGMHQMMPQNVSSGLPGQASLQQNGQNAHLAKQNIPNQPSQQNSMMPAMTTGQQNMGQQLINQSNPMLGMQMQNMRNPNQPVSMPGYPMNMQNQQPGSQPQNIQTSQMATPGQQMMQGHPLPGQTQVMSHPNHIPQTTQNTPTQVSQMPQTHGQHMPQQPSQAPVMPHHGQPIGMLGQQLQQSNQPMMMPGQQMPPQGQNGPQQSQQMLNQGQHMAQGQMHPSQGQQIMPGQQIQGNMMHQTQQIPQMQGPIQMGGTIQQIKPGVIQGQAVPQNIQLAQQIKMQPPNLNNVPQEQQQTTMSQTDQVQTPVKSEHNNNTAELISFD